MGSVACFYTAGSLVVAQHRRLDRFEPTQNRIQSLRPLPNCRELLQKGIL
jgi:hypothetical protein